MKWRLRILFLCAFPFAAQVQGATLGEPVALPVFSFHDKHGTTYASADLIDQWTVIKNGLLTCPSVCSLMPGNFEAAIAEIAIRLHRKDLLK